MGFSQIEKGNCFIETHKKMLLKGNMTEWIDKL